jgi:hypothetical protein
MTWCPHHLMVQTNRESQSWPGSFRTGGSHQKTYKKRWWQKCIAKHLQRYACFQVPWMKIHEIQWTPWTVHCCQIYHMILSTLWSRGKHTAPHKKDDRISCGGNNNNCTLLRARKSHTLKETVSNNTKQKHYPVTIAKHTLSCNTNVASEWFTRAMHNMFQKKKNTNTEMKTCTIYNMQEMPWDA